MVYYLDDDTHGGSLLDNIRLVPSRVINHHTRELHMALTLCPAEIRAPKKADLVVKDGNDIISFAKWDLPVFKGEAYVDKPWVWPDGTNLAVLDEWMKKVEAAEERVLGGQQC